MNITFRMFRINAVFHSVVLLVWCKSDISHFLAEFVWKIYTKIEKLQFSQEAVYKYFSDIPFWIAYDMHFQSVYSKPRALQNEILLCFLRAVHL